jgi:alpha-N-acetylglucosamine transferase
VVKELKDTWNDVRNMERRAVTQMINSKLGNMVEKHDEYYNAMTARIASLEQKGVDTSELKSLAEEFKKVVDQMKVDQAAADQLWVEAKDNDLIDQAKEAQQKVREDMGESKDLLKEFMMKYRELAKPINKAINQAAPETDESSETLNETQPAPEVEAPVENATA